MATDPLSDVLSLLKPRGYMSGGVDAGGDWSIKFGQDEGFRCFALVSGQCWLSMDGVDDPVRLEAGDFVVLPHGRAFCLASDLTVTPVDLLTVIMAPLNGRILSYKGGGRASLSAHSSPSAEITPASCWECCRPSCTSAMTRIGRPCGGIWSA